MLKFFLIVFSLYLNLYLKPVIKIVRLFRRMMGLLGYIKNYARLSLHYERITELHHAAKTVSGSVRNMIIRYVE